MLIPSELFPLRWDGLNSSPPTLRVYSSKTEHFPGQSGRIVPLTPEVQSVLKELQASCPAGEVYLFPRLRKGRINLRQPLEQHGRGHSTGHTAGLGGAYKNADEGSGNQVQGGAGREDEDR